MDKYERHEQICKDLTQMYKAKNIAYGDAFGKTFQEMGSISAVVRMSDKWNRIKAISSGAKNDVQDEKLTDTLMDLANYCIMTLIELDIKAQGVVNEDAEEQGRLVRLPCKIGDTAYYWSTYTDESFNGVGDFKVCGIAVKTDGFYLIDENGSIDKLGLHVMLTREEAEVALNESKKA